MAPKPKTGGSFVKADTQTLSGGFKLAGNGGPHKISADRLEFDNLLIRRGPLLSNFCLTPSTIWLTFLSLVVGIQHVITQATYREVLAARVNTQIDSK